MPRTTPMFDLEQTLMAIGRVERELEALTRRDASVGELFPHTCVSCTISKTASPIYEETAA